LADFHSLSFIYAQAYSAGPAPKSLPPAPLGRHWQVVLNSSATHRAPSSRYSLSSSLINDCRPYFREENPFRLYPQRRSTPPRSSFSSSPMTPPLPPRPILPIPHMPPLREPIVASSKHPSCASARSVSVEPSTPHHKAPSLLSIDDPVPSLSPMACVRSTSSQQSTSLQLNPSSRGFTAGIPLLGQPT